MEILNKIIYWISTGLLVPTVLALIFLFVRGMLLLGGFYGFYVGRLKNNKRLSPVLQDLTPTGLQHLEESNTRRNSLYTVSLDRLLTYEDSKVHREKILTDFELASEKDLDLSRTLSKVGPILGLMGTLIPIQPALVGLTNGDLTSIAQNMQEGFASTIIGLVIGGIGFLTLQVKQRWHNEDLANLEFINEIINEKQKKTI